MPVALFPYEAAERYAAAGLAVFPCRSGGKEPLTRHGCRDATSETDVVRRMFDPLTVGLFPNIGCAVPPDGMVLDVDGPDGAASLAQLEAAHGPLPPTASVQTGGGGRHYWFLLPAGATARNSVGKLAPGLDIRADGGYVLLPGSRTADAYRWEGPDAIAPAPAWLLATPAPAPAATPMKGRRHQTLMKLGGKLLRDGLSPDGIRAALLVENQAYAEPKPEAEVLRIADYLATCPPDKADKAEAALHRETLLAAPPVDGAAMLADLTAFIRRFVVLSEPQSLLLALGIAHSWAYRQFDYAPIWHITAPEKRCGKSRLLEVVRLFAWQPWITGKTTAANLQARCADGCTLLLDETDAALEQDREYVAALRAILDCRFEADKPASLRVPNGPKGWESVDLDVFGPTWLAGIGQLPDTIADRSIPIMMRRKLKGEACEKLRKAA